MRRLGTWVICSLVLGGATTLGVAQPMITYDASSEGIPSGPCWNFVEGLDPVVPYTKEVLGDDLHISTMNLQASGDRGGTASVYRSDPAINFNQPWAVEARVRILEAPFRSINTFTGWPRPGFAVTVTDNAGRGVWIGLSEVEVFLSNHFFGQYGSSNTVTAPIDTTSAHRVYRLEGAGTGVARLFVDGVEVLSISAINNAGGGAGEVYAGDPTFWANSDFLLTYLSYSNAGSQPCCDSIDFNADGASFDPQDIDAFLSVFSEGPCIPETATCNDIDFNNDGALFDPCDIDSFLLVFSEGPCTLCGE